MNKSGARVLVVDDQRPIRTQLCRALEAVGVQCDSAVDGDDGLVQYLYGGHELVVTDLRMPQENGHSFAVTVLGLPNPPKVVALTAVTEPRLAADLKARGVVEVAYKPIDYFEFADRLKGMLARLPGNLEKGNGDLTAKTPLDHSNGSQRQGELVAPNRAELEQHFADALPPHPWLTLTMRTLDWEQLPNPPLEMRNVLRKLARPTSDQLERRREERVTLNDKVVALALNDALEPVGQPFKAIIKDVSEHGIGLIHAEKLEKQPLAVSWQGLEKKRIIILARVLRCRQVDEYFDIGAAIARFKSQTLGKP